MGLYRGSGGLVKTLKYVIKSFFHKIAVTFKRTFEKLFKNTKQKHKTAFCQAPLLKKSSYTFFRTCQITPYTSVAPHLHTHTRVIARTPARTGEVKPRRTPLFFPLNYRAYARTRTHTRIALCQTEVTEHDPPLLTPVKNFFKTFLPLLFQKIL